MKNLSLIITILALSGCSMFSMFSDVENQEKPIIKLLSFENNVTKVNSLDRKVWKNYSPDERGKVLKVIEQVAGENSQKLIVNNHEICFRGTPEQIKNNFFNGFNVSSFENTPYVQYPESSKHYIRVSYKSSVSKKSLRFKISHCSQDRGSELDKNAIASNWDITRFDLKARIPSQSQGHFPPVIPKDKEGNVNGFIVVDPLTDEEVAVLKNKRIKPFVPRHDFQNAKVGEEDMGWRKFGWDIKKPEDALKFALYMQKYVYEGFTKSRRHDHQFNAWKNEQRYWCHTPWLNPGVKGREAVHGLTREFPIEHSAVYPSYTKDLHFYQRPVSWGGAYFNSVACQTYNKVFGNPEEGIINPPNWRESIYPDGTVSFKMLFNSGIDKKTGELLVPEFKGAYRWTSHTGLTFSKKEERKLRKMYHIQMDISFKDSKLAGTNPDLKHWGMITYYYDKSYKGPSEFFGSDEKVESPWDIKGLPKGLKHMRPVGVQFGMDAGDSIIFKGAKNNHTLAEDEAKHYVHGETRLNGPADNPVSSCLSCHGAAGLNVKIPPGIMTNDQYVESLTEESLDFNMQIDLAKKYYEDSMSAIKEEQLQQQEE